MDFNTLLTNYGPYAAIALYFMYKEAWPWFRDRFIPHVAAEKAAEREALSKALEAHRAASQQREDRLFGVIEQSISIMSRIEGTLDGIKDAMTVQTAELERHANVLHTVNLDLAGLYVILGQDRLSQRNATQEHPR